MTLFQISFDEDAKDHRGSNVTRDYISNYVYVIGSCMHTCISFELYDYIVVLWTVSVTHVTLVSEADSYLLSERLNNGLATTGTNNRRFSEGMDPF